jgi:hypothetical protein
VQGVEPPPLLYPGGHAAAKHRLTFPLTYSFLHKHVQNILYAFKNYLLNSDTTFPCLFVPETQQAQKKGMGGSGKGGK